MELEDREMLVNEAYPAPRQTTQPRRLSNAKQANVIRISDIEPASVSFLWLPYIPIGKLTFLEGDPSVGKTFLALQLAALISKGAPLPGADGKPDQHSEPGQVLYMSAEDGLADTLRPRLDKMQADINKIHVLTGWKTEAGGAGLITLKDVLIIEQALEQVRPVLLVIDPIQGYLGAGVDMHRANEVRPVLSSLSILGEKYGAAMLCIRHLSKQSNKAIYRGMGSIDFTAAARSIILAGQDPENPDKRGLFHLKSSLAEAGPAIGYSITNDGFFWTGLSDLTVNAVLKAESQSDDDRSAIDEAVEFLEAVLTDGPVSCLQVSAEADELGISKRTLERAKVKLGIKSIREGGQWSWMKTATK